MNQRKEKGPRKKQTPVNASRTSSVVYDNDEDQRSFGADDGSVSKKVKLNEPGGYIRNEPSQGEASTKRSMRPRDSSKRPNYSEKSHVLDEAISENVKRDKVFFKGKDKEALARNERAAQFFSTIARDSRTTIDGKDYLSKDVAHGEGARREVDSLYQARGGTEDVDLVFKASVKQRLAGADKKSKTAKEGGTVTHNFPVLFSAKKQQSTFDVMVYPLTMNEENRRLKKVTQYDYDTIGGQLDSLVDGELDNYKRSKNSTVTRNDAIGYVNANIQRMHEGRSLSPTLRPGSVKTLSDFVMLQNLEMARAQKNVQGKQHVREQMTGVGTPFSARYNRTSGTMVGSHVKGAEKLRNYSEKKR